MLIHDLNYLRMTWNFMSANYKDINHWAWFQNNWNVFRVQTKIWVENDENIRKV